jgi:hypothetical protein
LKTLHITEGTIPPVTTPSFRLPFQSLTSTVSAPNQSDSCKVSPRQHNNANQQQPQGTPSSSHQVPHRCAQRLLPQWCAYVRAPRACHRRHRCHEILGRCDTGPDRDVTEALETTRMVESHAAYSSMLDTTVHIRHAPVPMNRHGT